MGKFCWLKGARTKRSNDAGEEKKKKLRGNKLKKKRGKGERERGSQKTKEKKEKVVETGKLASLIALRHTKPYA